MDKMIDFTQYKNGDKVKSLEKRVTVCRSYSLYQWSCV